MFPLQAIKLQTASVENYMPLLDQNVNTRYDQAAKSILSYSLNQGLICRQFS